jgi:uroporphyrinogen decarboxylase
MTMTPRERWLALMDGRKPDRIPTDYWATNEVTEHLMDELSCETFDDLRNKLHIDGVDKIGAPSTVTHFPGNPDANIWGVTFSMVDYGAGVYEEAVTHPLAIFTTVEQIDNFPWPDPDMHDWDNFRRRIQKTSGYRVVRCGGYEPFLLYCEMRGMEMAMMDLLINPEIVDAALEHIFKYYYRLNERMFEIANNRIDITYIAEDLGSQHGLLFSMDQIQQFILPNQKKMADLARSHEIRIFYHTDGAAREAIPDLIKITGIDILNPIQWRCPGMDRENLVRDFGDKIIFHGAMDNQQTLSFGSVDDVKNEVLDNIRIFATARWICAPCHNIQTISPTENIVTMYKSIWQNGKL